MKGNILLSVLLGSFLLLPQLQAENWPQFRGPNATGISGEKDIPVKWSRTENVRWRTELPGPGHSSPAVWGDKIFLTAFEAGDGAFSLRRLFRGTTGKLWAMALSARDGSILWKKAVPTEDIEGTHDTNSPASPTPVTDGERVYFYFGSYGLICYDLEGNKKWELPLGPYDNAWGSASSPILYGDTLIQNLDNDEDSYLLALDKKTGKRKWRTSRSGFRRGYTTPMLWKANGRTELVVSGSYKVTSYNPETGQEHWTCRGLTRWVSPTPVAAHGLLFVTSNGPGGSVFLAIRPGGKCDITDSHVAWKYDRGAPYIPSPLVVGDYLYAVRNGGVATCLNAKTGEVAWQQRLPAGGKYYSSPIYADGKIYMTSEEGKISVLEAGPEYKLLGVNDMEERSMATPVVSNGQIFLRSDHALYSIGAPRN